MKAIIRFLCVFILCAFSILSGSAEDGLLTIYFVDVGQADSTIITCDDDVLMIDGGNVADSRLIYSMLRNTLGIQHIDFMIATHPHEDHVGGLAAALNACSVDVLFTPVLDYDTKAFHSMMKYAQAQETEIKVPNNRAGAHKQPRAQEQTKVCLHLTPCVDAPDPTRYDRVRQRRSKLLGLLLAVLCAVPGRGVLRLAGHRHHLGRAVRLVADSGNRESERHLAQRSCEAVEDGEADPDVGSDRRHCRRSLLADRTPGLMEEM